MKIETTRRRARGGAEGFTLIELMVVVAIIAILAAIVLPNVLSNVDEANVTKAKAEMNSFKVALTQYKLKFKKFPTTGEGMQALVNNAAGIKMIDAVPKDPWGNDYIYRSPGTQGNDFEIISYGEDGQPGGTGYNADIESWNLSQ